MKKLLEKVWENYKLEKVWGNQIEKAKFENTKFEKVCVEIFLRKYWNKKAKSENGNWKNELEKRTGKKTGKVCVTKFV